MTSSPMLAQIILKEFVSFDSLMEPSFFCIFHRKRNKRLRILPQDVSLCDVFTRAHFCQLTIASQ